ncbi:ATP-dependent Clp protease adaptor ClpS [Desulfurispirillum indicum]|uniref:ATP-dependent Clp protease adapter protein ClpS n=1 Tax=Desulfurispirillum indicum (strain ATCC BAA-1389 / DSM 22839 / S5) TaxID=653733 RepID=E6W3W7_DESIS|nr:ATP-dependent Clp protease adaptor ClpS [Desulfurispirillum indicum]ADU65835.1 ATP-dependent Clp protease adaptor protein ClpS [Desulfurispirillum indicum S5]UCZ57770.1 ATP-dependent Clp protease adaptor ClpS [Desulfurispirillum indicum]
MSSSKPRIEEELDLAVKEPRPYMVLLLNDDFSTWDFVVEVLVRVFRKTRDDADKITYHVHHNGQGVCGIYPFEIAQTKVQQVHELAKSRGYPLRCVMREV